MWVTKSIGTLATGTLKMKLGIEFAQTVQKVIGKYTSF
jgi:hypothetical protein